MFLANCSGQLGIGGLHLNFKRASPRRELAFDCLNSRCLLFGEIKPLMHNIV
jgi:hypothetical protein